MAQRVTLAIPSPTTPSQDVNVSTTNPLPVSGGGSSSAPDIVGFGAASSPTDGASNTNRTVSVLDNTATGRGGFNVYPAVFNGTTWDRQRGDTTGTFVKTPPSTGTDRSITATTTSQQLMAANALRTKFFIKNDTAIVVWINMGATAVAAAGGGNIAIAANGGFFEFTGASGVINIIAASTTAAVTAREF